MCRHGGRQRWSRWRRCGWSSQAGSTPRVISKISQFSTLSDSLDCIDPEQSYCRGADFGTPFEEVAIKPEMIQPDRVAAHTLFKVLSAPRDACEVFVHVLRTPRSRGLCVEDVRQAAGTCPPRTGGSHPANQQPLRAARASSRHGRFCALGAHEIRPDRSSSLEAFGDCGLADRERPGQFRYRRLTRREPGENRPPRWVRTRGERRIKTLGSNRHSRRIGDAELLGDCR